LTGLLLALALAFPADAPPRTLADCVRIARTSNAEIAEAEAKVAQYKARLAQVQSVFYPKLSGMMYIAPINTVRGSALEKDVERDYSFNAWGPYTHIEAVLAQPLYTFGRVSAGKRAAAARAAVEQARVRQVENFVGLEVKRLFYAHLMAKSVLPTIANVSKIVNEAREKAQEEYDNKTGKVSKADLMRLEFAQTEVAKVRHQAVDGAALALAALKHTMGMSADQPLALAAKKLPKLPRPAEKLDLTDLMRRAAEGRPEWAQLKQGEKAAIALESAEKLANAPVLFLAGTIDFDWAPTRDDSKNPYHNDQFNDLSGGIAVGLKFDIDAGMSVAKAKEARALRDQVRALRRFARTGIPLQVRKAYDEVVRQRKLTKLSNKGVRATRKWMAFSGLAFKSGTGEAKDLLEGVGAYVAAKKGYYDALLAYHIARAELDHAIGR